MKAKHKEGGAKPAEKRTSVGGERELIVIAEGSMGLRARGAAVASATGADVSHLAKALSKHGLRMTPLFGVSEERIQAAAAAELHRGITTPDLSVYYRVDAAEDEMDDLAAEFAAMPGVAAAYVKPAAEAPVFEVAAAAPEEAPPVTPDFTARQGYLEAAPGGIDARFAWTRPGGGGAGVRIIDVEGAWRFSHEDLTQNQGGVAGGTPSADIGWRNHGTAVIGEFGGDRNSVGVTGICPDANTRAISIFGPGWGSAPAIRRAADLLGPGDIILIELHRPGPRFAFANRADQRGYIAVEWWPDDLAAIRYAVGRGVIVVEAAGNGAENLDDALYSARPAGFPSTWVNPFRRAPVDSGAVLVGAGAPPPGTHGRNHGPDRSRLDFSNFGACLDAQGWGREVTTCGYGDLQGGASEDVWYTDTFSGTSSASPIVVGALGSIQGALRARSRPLLTPATARNILRTSGSPQQAAPGRPVTQRIGNRPNLREAINRLIPKSIKEFTKDKLEKIETKEIEKKDHKEISKEVIKEIEKKDHKEITKEVTKELKEKEFKEFKEGKEFKEKDKDLVEGGFGHQLNPPPEASGSLEARLTALEQAIGQFAHFISPELRPDLADSALNNEPPPQS